MAHLVQCNIMISEHGQAEYRIYATIHFRMGINMYAYDFDIIRPLKTGDPKINAQVEEMCLKFAEAVAWEERGGQGADSRRLVPQE